MRRIIPMFLLFASLLATSAAAAPNHYAGAFAHPNAKESIGVWAIDVPDPQGGGSHSVALTCTPGVPATGQDPATSFNFKRSLTTGGPYTTIGSSPTCSFTDTNVTAGTKYFYVATGVNTGGESANSNEASALIPSFPPPAPGSLSGLPK